MRLELSPRQTVWPLFRFLSPFLAIAVAGLLAAFVILILGQSPVAAFDVYIVSPLDDSWALQEIAIKMVPLMLIATGLIFCFRANLWNIGAEGQFTFGAICGSILPLMTQGMETGSWVMVIALLMGLIGGALYAFIPAYLRARLGVSEILSSLMLVYIAQLFLDWLVRGPWRDPHGFNFPQTVNFDAPALLPVLIDDGRLHAGIILAGLAIIISVIVLSLSLFGFSIKVIGSAPKAAGFSGFSTEKTIFAVFVISGALSGLAGIVEVLGHIGQLKPSISTNAGFTAITVAFLGRLNPLGVVFGAFIVALTTIGGENAQIALKLPLDLTTCFQGLLLLCVLAADAVTSYRIRFVSTQSTTDPHAGAA
jgi:general nucleoside transport system permease protein